MPSDKGNYSPGASYNLLSLLAFLAFSTLLNAEQTVTIENTKKPKPFPQTHSPKEIADKNTESMTGTNQLNFPPLTFKDIPMLLKMARSKKKVSPCPSNSISSYHHSQCSEGMSALWFIEGVRQGGKYPSLNALILPRNNKDPLKENNQKWPEVSEKHHDHLLKLYLVWWEKVKSDKKLMLEFDPLKDTYLHWY